MLTRPFTWFYIHVLRLEPAGEPIAEEFWLNDNPWKGDFWRRVFEWNWELETALCQIPHYERGEWYSLLSDILRSVGYNA